MEYVHSEDMPFDDTDLISAYTMARFWDSYSTSIHINPQLTQIDEFNYLHSLLEEEAARSIQGLTRTEANYDSAIDLLHKRFGKP